jgi:hypothetical protein
MIFGNTFYEIAAILGLAAVIGALGQKLRQPLIIMFLGTGIVAGPACLGVIESHQQIELLAQIGIALLLFIVGLRLDLDLIRTTGAVALATGLGQIVFTSAIGGRQRFSRLQQGSRGVSRWRLVGLYGLPGRYRSSFNGPARLFAAVFLHRPRGTRTEPAVNLPPS